MVAVVAALSWHAVTLLPSPLSIDLADPVLPSGAGLVDEPVPLHPNLSAIYGRKVAALPSLLENEATRTEAVEIVRSFIDQVIFRPAADAGLEIQLVGDIANMVHLAQSNENSPVFGAVHDEFTRSVKVVAGVGFEPTTFRL